MDVSIESLTNQLKSKGIRPSYQRVKVLEYMYQKGGHPTVDEIFRPLSADIPSLSKVTIYNTLRIFVEAGLLRIVDIDDTEKRYDITLTNHGHFQCEACGTIYNFQVNIDQVAIDGLNQFEITQKNVYFKGLCPNCLKQRTNRERSKDYESR
jgi:Fur family peroxide stress response transcriptional regulator